MPAKDIRRRLASWLVMALVGVVVYIFVTPSYRQGEPSVAGKKAENFGVVVDGRNKRLSDFRGKVVVLNFWASYCGSCVEELPDLNRLQERIRSRGGVILAVSVDEDCARYEDFLTKYPVRFQTSCEPTKKVSLDYGTEMIPETYVIDREGYIARKFVGAQRWDSAEITKYFDATLSQN